MDVDSIEWHKENLKNMIRYAEEDGKHIKLLQAMLDKDYIDINELTFQISEAEKEGKEKFDSTRYRVKKKKYF